MPLLLVESPTKAKTLKQFLGKDYQVIATMGHIRDLPKGELGVDIEKDFQPKYVIPYRSKKTISLLKKESKSHSTILIATDPDREGEAIAWHLVQALELNDYHRITFHEITKTAIEKSLKDLKEIDLDLVESQQSRRILDRIVGYKLSPFLWKKIARGLSAGRVQSVTLKLIADREKEIESFKSEEYWTIAAILKKDLEFEAILIKKDNKTIPKIGIKSKQEADEILKNLEKAEYRAISIEEKETKKNPLPPFTTSTLQQEAWKRFHFPAKLTMSIAQALYEKGISTYHRTDSLNLSASSLDEAKEYIVNNYGKQYWFSRKYKAKGNVQEAHEAIRPTYPDKDPEKTKIQKKLDSNQYRLYNLIWRRFMASQMSQAVFNAVNIEIEAKNYTFRSSGQTLKFDGFLRAYPVKYKETELPEIKKRDLLELIKLVPDQHFTQPPPRFNEASLIKELEKNGIGRPSTYAPTLAVIQQRNYVQKDEQKRFLPTEIGLIVNDLLANHFPKIIDVQFTANMEKQLDEIAQGKKSSVEVLKDFYVPFDKNLQEKEEQVL